MKNIFNILYDIYHVFPKDIQKLKTELTQNYFNFILYKFRKQYKEPKIGILEYKKILARCLNLKMKLNNNILDDDDYEKLRIIYEVLNNLKELKKILEYELKTKLSPAYFYSILRKYKEKFRELNINQEGYKNYHDNSLVMAFNRYCISSL